MMLWLLGQVRPTMLRLGMRISSIFNPQQVATRRNREAKRTQHVVPDNVAMCFVQMLGSFGQSSKLVG